jgi:YYY domain-containing protein
MPIHATLTSIMHSGIRLYQQREPLTFDEPVGSLPIVDDARWSSALTGNSVGAFLVWVALLVALQFVGWPLVRRMFTRLPDRGWAFSRLVTLLLAGYGVWFLSSVHVISFRAIWAAVSLVAIAVLSVLVHRKMPPSRSESPIHRNPIAMTAEGIFWSVFALFLVFRLINPDSYHPYWGGEKPMEFAHLNAILRSAHFPPIDPWYSDGFINYYYYGTYLVAFLIKLTGIPVEFAFNLAQPTFPALLASASFSMTAALARRVTGSTTGALVSGLLGMVFVSFAGNMVVPTRLLDRLSNGGRPVDGWGFWFWGPSRSMPTPDTGYNITEFPYFGALYADMHPHVIAMPFTVLIVALAWQMASMRNALPVLVKTRSLSMGFAWSTIAPALISALALGSLFMTNAWDLPLFAIVVAAGVFMAASKLRGLVRQLIVSGVIVGVIALLALLATIPFNMHYVALFGEIDTVIDETPLVGIQSHVGGQLLLITLGIAAMMIPRSAMSRTAKIASGVALPGLLTLALLFQWQTNASGGDARRVAGYLVVLIASAIWTLSAWSATRDSTATTFSRVHARIRAVDIMIVTGVLLLLLDRPTLALYVAIGLSAAVMWTVVQRPSERFLLMIIAGATLLGASLELVYLVDDLRGGPWYRMNTIFKFYNQIWNLLGISVGVLAGRALWDALVYSGEEEPSETLQTRGEPGRLWTLVSAVMTGVVAIASLTYAVMATPPRLDTRFSGASGLTLNAYSWMEYGEITLFRIDGNQRIPVEPLRYEDDLQAITWLNENVHGSPVIAEAAFGTYRCNGSRYSIATGLPAIIGWQRHQQQQRYLDDLAVREAALRELYTTSDTDRQLQIIEQYNVEYIIVGQTERHYPTIDGNECLDTGSPESIASLESLVGDRFEIAFQSGSTTIYRVLPE